MMTSGRSMFPVEDAMGKKQEYSWAGSGLFLQVRGMGRRPQGEKGNREQIDMNCDLSLHSKLY